MTKCPACDTMFKPRKTQQVYCSNPTCQRARKTAYEKVYRKKVRGNDRSALSTRPTRELPSVEAILRSPMGRTAVMIDRLLREAHAK
jgi:DNA-directed RNA polymerase subunit M/transcription elongation factor TFIIS